MPVANRKDKPAKKQTREQVKPKTKPVIPPVKVSNVTELRKRLQLTQAEFARLIPISIRSLATLESGTSPTEVVERRLIELRRLINALTEVIREDAIGAWLQTPNDAFDGLKPLEVIDRGESDRLWSMIFFLRSGVPS